MSNDGDNYRTPDRLFRALNAEFQFTVDAAADSNNAKCRRHICAGTDALRVSWRSPRDGIQTRAWCNPPYSKPNIPAFLQKAWLESTGGVLSVLLVPLDPSKAWIEWVNGKAAEVRILVPGRIRFDGMGGEKAESSASKPSCLILYRPGHVGDTHFRLFPRAALEERAAKLNK